MTHRTFPGVLPPAVTPCRDDLVHEDGDGSERTRAPRLPLGGEERKRILSVIRKGISTRPDTSKR